ncbi:MAG: IS4 family transposase [Bdellovibrionota bacterium]
MEAKVEFSYGDFRIDKLVKNFYQSIIEKGSICIRAIAGCRKKEVSFHRLIKNEKFSIEKMIQEEVIKTQSIITNEDHILCIQDSSELKFDVDRKRVREGLGPLGRPFCKGFFIHLGLLVDAKNYSILGLSDVSYWIRKEEIIVKDENGKSVKNNNYKKLPIEEKESYRWIKLSENTKSNFSHANKITIIADRESDIYEEWDRIPERNVYLLTRASRDRILSNNSSLYDELDKFQPSFCYKINLSEITNKREKRVAHVEVSYSSVEILKPKNCKDKNAKKNIILNAILVREVTSGVPEKDRVLWRLLTTHDIKNAMDVCQIITWYSKRWLIEQLFRTLKTQGINIESSQLESAESLIKLSIAGIITAVKTMQLVQARDGENNRKINDVFQKEDFEILENLNKKLEGKTEKQKNPHKAESLSWGSWIIARLGGWMGYSCERPPGPITIKRGLDYFQKIKVGWMLSKDVCIP